MLEENPELIREIYRILKSHPDWNDARIYEALSSDTGKATIREN